MTALAALVVDERDRDAGLVSLPRPEVHLVMRTGPMCATGLDVHVFGARHKVRRKVLRAGQRTVMARLHLGATEAVLGVPASAIAERIVPLDELWGAAATRPLLDQLAAAPTGNDAAAILERAITERYVAAPRSLALVAAEKLASARITEVADELGVSERHLRRVFREATGVSPKAFARLARFHRALAAARAGRHSWASIAAATGYYDQAHLIDEFRAIAGATPRVLLGELVMVS